MCLCSLSESSLSHFKFSFSVVCGLLEKNRLLSTIPEKASPMKEGGKPMPCDRENCMKKKTAGRQMEMGHLDVNDNGVTTTIDPSIY